MQHANLSPGAPPPAAAAAPPPRPPQNRRQYVQNNAVRPAPGGIFGDGTRVGEVAKQLDVDSSGKLVIKSRPWEVICFAIPFFLPFPFLCMGMASCFIGRSYVLTFNDNTRRISFVGHCGAMCVCIKRLSARTSYEDVVDFVVAYSGTPGNALDLGNHQVCMNLTNGKQVGVAKPSTFEMATALCASLNNFMAPRKVSI